MAGKIQSLNASQVHANTPKIRERSSTIIEVKVERKAYVNTTVLYVRSSVASMTSTLSCYKSV